MDDEDQGFSLPPPKPKQPSLAMPVTTPPP